MKGCELGIGGIRINRGVKIRYIYQATQAHVPLGLSMNIRRLTRFVERFWPLVCSARGRRASSIFLHKTRHVRLQPFVNMT